MQFDDARRDATMDAGTLDELAPEAPLEPQLENEAERETSAASTSADEAAQRGQENRSTTPRGEAFSRFMASGWDVRDEPTPEPLEVAKHTPARRAAISRLYPGKRLVVPAGAAKVRANDTDYPYRAHSAFTWLTGWAAGAVPESVLVFEPTQNGHEVTLYTRDRAGYDTDEFFANPEIGEFWVGARPTLAQVEAMLQIPTRDLAEVEPVLESFAEGSGAMIAGADDALTLRLRGEGGALPIDGELHRDLDELRLVKDEWEVNELREAVNSTGRGFEDAIRALPHAKAVARSERVIEGVFALRARVEGNDVGYSSIAAGGKNACTLHYTVNGDRLVDGQLVLADMGVERDSYYTADITRTLPLSGEFTKTQREVYEAVREASDAAFAMVRPGVRFRELHRAAMRVIAKYADKWGMLPGTLEDSLQEDHQFHRRFMVHGTSHHLGLDVHDCAQAKREMYMDGILEPGMVFTIEPGLYFQPDDLTVPAELRGIGIRIEDDIVVTEDGCVNLSANIPRTADDVERWVQGARKA